MSTDKMRNEFEAWWQATMNTAMFDLYRFGDGYDCHETNRAWMAWQASRAALVIELPDWFSPNDCGDKAYWADLVDKAIDAAGVKTKLS